MPRLFVVGLGYVGLRLGLQCRELGWEVSGSCRDAERARALYDAHGLDAHAFDGSSRSEGTLGHDVGYESRKTGSTAYSDCERPRGA